MKAKFLNMVILTGLFISYSTHAWTPNGNSLRIKGIYQWEGNERVVLELDNGEKCYIPSEEKNLISFVYMLYINKQKASWHCYDATSSVGGYNAHRLHRVVAIH